MVSLAAGLLSTGKYHDEDTAEHVAPALLSYDRSEDYEAEDFFLRKHPLAISSEAGALLHDLWLEVLEYNGVERELDLRALIEDELEKRM
jgi:hypothetical protein